MTSLVPIMMFGWIPITFILFMAMDARKAALVSLVIGWLFLPGARIQFSGIPDYTKVVAVCLPIILSTIIVDSQRLRKLSPSKLDIPIIIWLCCAFASSISNGLGAYDGLSGVVNQLFHWGFPYAIGKMYFSDSRGLRDLAVWVVLGGLIYIPFCIWEMRMSPNLNFYVYGFRTDRFLTTIRFGGYRPVVFLQHGVAVGVWMMSAVLMGIWLWRRKCLKMLFGVSMGFNVIALFIVFILCRSLNSIILFIGGLFSYRAIGTWKWKIIAICLAITPVIYVVSRNVGFITTDQLVNIASKIDEERALSLYGRMYHEERLLEKAKQRPIFGWGGWGRNRVYNDQGEDTSVTDGLWILAFGIHGYVGLISLGLVLLLPTLVFWRRYRFVDWGHSNLAPMVGFIIIIPLYTIDCLMNAMVNPIFTVASGAILGWLATSESDPVNFSESHSE